MRVNAGPDAARTRLHVSTLRLDIGGTFPLTTPTDRFQGQSRHRSAWRLLPFMTQRGHKNSGARSVTRQNKLRLPHNDGGKNGYKQCCGLLFAT